MKKEMYELIHGDCIKEMKKISKAKIEFDLSVFSPPFSSLYAYNSDISDMGNSKESDDEFRLHFEFFAKAIFPLIKAGRNMCVHIQNPSRSKTNHGYMGIYDLRGEMIRIFEKAGFVYYGEISIRKNPQAQSIRTKAHALTFTQFTKDSSKSRPALLDYLLILKKPGDNQVPCTAEKQVNEHRAKERKDVTNQDWIEWAEGIWCTDENGIILNYGGAWFDISETNTLNARAARSEKDEKHICPLQIDLIERCVKLWSNPGETVFSPFTGIGSEGYVSVINDRKFVGIELKDEYYSQAIKNLDIAVDIRKNKNNQQEMAL